MSILLDQIHLHKKGHQNGVYCVCSAHPYVIEASVRHALDNDAVLIIEATSNQVDQFGGYTGMTPEDFKNFVLKLANKYNFPREKLVLGGDHLGPNRWQYSETAEEAMKKSEDLIAAYVAAGFKKIHLDCSMSCVGDPVPLTDEIVAERAARLAIVAERTCKEKFGVNDCLYIIGTEVPVPGGAQETLSTVEVTPTSRASTTLEVHKAAFEAHGLKDIWNRVIGLVVQPGVEFDHVGVVNYDPSLTVELSNLLNNYENLVFEAHSTDYQKDSSYPALVQNHFAILKVGPALTYAMREALYKLAYCEDILVSDEAKRSNLLAVIEDVMLNSQPDYWSKYYHGTPEEQKFARSYSLSDRIRYYWPNGRIQQACKTLFANLEETGIPLPLLMQFFPQQLNSVRDGKLGATPKDLVLDSIAAVNRVYSAACQGK